MFDAVTHVVQDKGTGGEEGQASPRAHPSRPGNSLPYATVRSIRYGVRYESSPGADRVELIDLHVHIKVRARLV